MIIRHPTALYSNQIPQEPSDGGNVTFTISMENPERDDQQVTRLPPAVELREKTGDRLTDEERRAALGDYAYSVNESQADQVGTSKKQYEAGQVLEFTTEEIAPLNPMLVSKRTEIRHDTNKLDLTGLGISQDDINTIDSIASTQMDDLYAELSVQKNKRKNAETAIGENQKTQNETNKAIAAINELVDTAPELSQTIKELEANLKRLQDEATELRTEANDASSAADSILEQIRNVAQVVR